VRYRLMLVLVSLIGAAIVLMSALFALLEAR
jgi:hypothetical protein